MTQLDYALPGVAVGPPWAAEHFQVKRNGTRGYADTLPPCGLIPDPHVDPVPGYSSLKPSKPFRKSVMVGDTKYTVPLDWYRAGEWVMDYEHSLDRYDHDILSDFYRGVNTQRDRDFARGHAIHQAAEDVLNGKPMSVTNPDAQPYLPHLTKWLEDNVTDVCALEAPVFGVGYGGTGDAWLGVRGVAVYCDWKSRGADSAHGIYEEEVAQGGAYTSARYCILPSDDRQTAVRAPLPAATYGLVLSLRPDGVQEYWYDLDGARDSFKAMHDAYLSTSVSGKLARAAKIKDPTTTIETAKRKNPGRPATVATVTPNEGGAVADVAELRTRYLTLEPAARTWVDAKREEAVKGLCDFHLANNYTERRAAIMDALMTLAVAEADDDDTTKALVRFVTDDDACQWLTVPCGVAVGSLGASQAKAFADACRLFVGFGLALEFDEHGAKVITA